MCIKILLKHQKCKFLEISINKMEIWQGKNCVLGSPSWLHIANANMYKEVERWQYSLKYCLVEKQIQNKLYRSLCKSITFMAVVKLKGVGTEVSKKKK